MVNFREARRLYGVKALNQGPRWAIRKFALERAFLNKKKLSVVSGYIARLVYEPNDGEPRLEILHTKNTHFERVVSLALKVT